MQKIKGFCAILGIMLFVTACGDSASETRTVADSSASMAPVGAEPAPSNNATNMANTSVDSLRNTTDIKVDTPPINR